MQGEKDLKTSNPIEDSNTSKSSYQGAIPKIKFQNLNSDNKLSHSVKGLQNGCAPEAEKNNKILMGTSFLPSVSASSSQLSANKELNEEIFELDLAEKNVFKCKASGSNDLKSCDRRRSRGISLDYENSSGNEGDDGLSADDCCIYTYKGDQFADLPNSFFPAETIGNDNNLSQGESQMRSFSRRNQAQVVERSSSGSSPDMDYLEMDFDPGPSLEQDSEEEVDGFERSVNNGDTVPDLQSDQLFDNNEDLNESIENSQDSEEPIPGPSNEIYKRCLLKTNKVSDCNSNNYNRTKEMLNSCCTGICSVVRNNENCDLISSNCVSQEKSMSEENYVSSLKSLLFDEKKEEKKSSLPTTSELRLTKEHKSEVDSKSPFDGIMLWTEQEAISKQVTMVASEVSCCVAAFVNVMLVLKMRFSIEKVKEGIATRLKSDAATIPQYLVSRSFGGVAQENLIRGIHNVSHGYLYARFFQMYPRRDIRLSRWLSHWMKKGAVPIATTNVQRDVTQEAPAQDSRHHQMIFGVNSKGIYLTNPMECLKDEELMCRLTNPSVLKIKRQEIVSRWSPDTNLKPLMFQNDDRWKTMNVLGQVANIIRESPDPTANEKFLTQHISIPASSGITLIIPRNSMGYEELASAPDLPICSLSKSE